MWNGLLSVFQNESNSQQFSAKIRPSTFVVHTYGDSSAKFLPVTCVRARAQFCLLLAACSLLIITISVFSIEAKNMTFVRFPKCVATYSMIKHNPDKRNPYNKARWVTVESRVRPGVSGVSWCRLNDSGVVISRIALVRAVADRAIDPSRPALSDC